MEYQARRSSSTAHLSCLEICSILQTQARQLGMEIFSATAGLVFKPGTKEPCGRPEVWLQHYQSPADIVAVIESSEKFPTLLKEVPDPARHLSGRILDWLDSLEAALEAYNMVFSQRWVTCDTLLKSPQSRHSDQPQPEIWQAVLHFLQHYATRTSLRGTSTPRELAIYRSKKCTVMIRILQLLRTVVRLDAACVPSTCWQSTELLPFIAKCVLHPVLLDFDQNDLEVTQQLPRHTSALLQDLLQHLTGERRQRLVDTLQTLLSQPESDVVGFARRLSSESLLHPLVHNAVSGFQQLLAVDILDACLTDSRAELARRLLTALFEYSGSASFQPLASETACLLMELALALNVRRQQLLDCILNDEEAPGDGRRSFTQEVGPAARELVTKRGSRGARFVHTFRTPLAGYIARSMADYAAPLFERLSVTAVSQLLQHAAECLRNNKELHRYREPFFTAFFDHIAQLQQLWGRRKTHLQTLKRILRLLDSVRDKGNGEKNDQQVLDVSPFDKAALTSFLSFAFLAVLKKI